MAAKINSKLPKRVLPRAWIEFVRERVRVDREDTTARLDLLLSGVVPTGDLWLLRWHGYVYGPLRQDAEPPWPLNRTSVFSNAMLPGSWRFVKTPHWPIPAKSARFGG